MRICIIGCGSIGLLLAAKIASAGEDVTLICRRPEQVSLIRSRGVKVSYLSGIGIAKVKSILAWRDVAYCDHVIIAVKAYDTRAALDVLKSCCKGFRLVVSAQNGIGPLEEVEGTLGVDRSAAMLLYIGARRVEDNLVEHLGGNRVVIGTRSTSKSTYEDLKDLRDVLSSAGFNVDMVDDIDAWRWDKLLVNAAINPVTAILMSPNRVIIESVHAKSLALTLAREGEEVARRLNIRLPRDVEKAVITTASETASNKSSMLQDIEMGRKTEIDYINGVIVRLGEQHNVPTPYNRAVYLAVKALEDVMTRR